MNETAASSERSEPEPAIGAVLGLFGSLKALAATLLAVAHTRLELLTTELQEEIQRAAGLVVWGFVALLAAMIGLFFGGLTIVLVYWDTHRILAALLVTGVFIGLAVAAVAVLIVKSNSRPRLLDATLNELAKDAQALKSRTAKE